MQGSSSLLACSCSSNSSTVKLPVSSSVSESSVGGWAAGGGSASLRSYFPSLPILYELVLLVSHWTLIHPSSPSSPMTLPRPGAGPSWTEHTQGQILNTRPLFPVLTSNSKNAIQQLPKCLLKGFRYLISPFPVNSPHDPGAYLHHGSQLGTRGR